MGDFGAGTFESYHEIYFTFPPPFLIIHSFIYYALVMLPLVSSSPSGNNNDNDNNKRIPWTWYGILIGTIWFYIFFLFIYSQLGKWFGPGITTFYYFLGVTEHILGASSLNYVIMLFIPIGGIAIDIAGKTFSNMYYPSQNQIHLELESKSKKLTCSKIEKGQ